MDRPKTATPHRLCVTVDRAESINPRKPPDPTAPPHQGTLNQLFYTLFIRLWGLQGLVSTSLTPTVHCELSVCKKLFGPALNQSWQGTSVVCHLSSHWMFFWGGTRLKQCTTSRAECVKTRGSRTFSDQGPLNYYTYRHYYRRLHLLLWITAGTVIWDRDTWDQIISFFSPLTLLGTDPLDTPSGAPWWSLDSTLRAAG